MDVHGRAVEVPATPYIMEWDDPQFPPAPGIGEHDPLPEATEARAGGL